MGIKKVKKRNILGVISISNKNESEIVSVFVQKQIKKCKSRLRSNDYDGAISSARSLIEGILGEIYDKSTGTKLEESGDLLKDYKKIKDLLNFSEEKYVEDGIKSIIRSFNGIIQSIDTLSNKIGDRHRPLITPSRHHAKLVVDSAITIADFLLSSMEYQSNRKNSFLNRLKKILDSEKRNFTREQLLEDLEIKELLVSSDVYLRQIAKQEFFKGFEVWNYRQSDIYFAAMRIFFEELNASDIASIYIGTTTNNQIVGWEKFEKELSIKKPDLLNDANEELWGYLNKD
ncbi:MAG: hypothetical protein UT55_C0074G0005 [Candidatus Peregrinibacteria bacterium GW2011_GWE2_39_6]|nr:MAG: hypothetical protein UT36_C0008G0029 [Candidatus Peregrinibacteria bacterium GW2011_GWF2_39_17]KKR24075.1 MAG: hypothetical protein UT55_C0074G0005 [Candidatus Peregrinibacteria bacterium GW2011_GWE2_39_6]HCW32068.1 hypothetical protein [Candidatus Peregrinibacteria bacterium]